jgi:hypothetical protein
MNDKWCNSVNNAILFFVLSNGIMKEDEVFNLIQKYPKAVQYKSKCGDYPLHHALLASKHSEKVIFQLLSIFPQATKERNIGFSLYLLHISCLMKKGEKIILT